MIKIKFNNQRHPLGASTQFFRFRLLASIFSILLYGFIFALEISSVVGQAPTVGKNAYNVSTQYFTSRCYEKKLSIKRFLNAKCALRFHFRPINQTWETVKIFRRNEPEVSGYASFEGHLKSNEGNISYILNTFTNGEKCRLSFTRIKNGLEVFPYNSTEFNCDAKEFKATYKPLAYPTLPSFAYGYPRRPPQELIDAAMAHNASFSQPRFINLTYQLVFEKQKMRFSNLSNYFHYKLQTYFIQHPILPGLHLRLLKRPDLVHGFWNSSDFQPRIHQEKGYIQTKTSDLSTLTDQFSKLNASTNVTLGIHLTPLLLEESGFKLGSALVFGILREKPKAITLLTTGPEDKEHAQKPMSDEMYVLKLLNTIIHETLHLFGADHADQAENPNFIHVMAPSASYKIEYYPLPMSWDTQLDLLMARKRFWKDSPIFRPYV